MPVPCKQQKHKLCTNKQTNKQKVKELTWTNYKLVMSSGLKNKMWTSTKSIFVLHNFRVFWT